MQSNTQSNADISESALQQLCFMWAWNQYAHLRGLYFEIHNNAHSVQSGMKHKAMGRIPGVADNCLLVPGGSSVFFEFKTPTGKQSPIQKNWEAIATKAGYKYYIVRSLSEFQNIWRQYV